MNRRTLSLSAALAGAALSLFMGASVAHALTLTLDLDYEFSNGTAPAGPGPWMRLTFDDSFGGPNTVRLTISAIGLTGLENADGVYINFDPALDPTLLTFTPISIAAAPPVAINTGVDAFQADGDGLFDVEFDLVPPGSVADRLTGGESIVYDLTYGSPITASSFDFYSEMGGGRGSYQAAAHIQRIGVNSDSGWIGPVPEPSTGALLGFGLLFAARRRARR